MKAKRCADAASDDLSMSLLRSLLNGDTEMTTQQIGGHRKVAHVVMAVVACTLILAIWMSATAIALCKCVVW